MDRREFLKRATIIPVAVTICPKRGLAAVQKRYDDIRKVLVFNKCHFDLGFTAEQSKVVDRYFNEFIPQAIWRAAELRRARTEAGYTWTVPSWVAFNYLEQASAADRQRFDEAVQSGAIAWHALPFTWNSELLDRPTFEAALNFCRSLDRRYGRNTTAAKLTDVPGHSRGIVSPLAGAGVRFLDVGCNPSWRVPHVPLFGNSVDLRSGASVAPEVFSHDPNIIVPWSEPFDRNTYLFLWRDPAGAEIVTLYHPGYGGTVLIPGTDLAVSINVKGDNSGPETAEEIVELHRNLRGLFPRASIVPANLSEIGDALWPLRRQLPIVTQEIGDTWIYGAASDPKKVAAFRELCRLREDWVAREAIIPGSPLDLSFTSHLITGVEHNWGLAVNPYLKHYDVYSPSELKAARRTSGDFERFDEEWLYKRRFAERALATLPQPLRDEGHMRLAQLQPDTSRSSVATRFDFSEALENRHFALRLDPQAGGISQFLVKSSSLNWASEQHPIAQLGYGTYSAEDYVRFNWVYGTTEAISPDFSKPGIDRYPVERGVWNGSLKNAVYLREPGGIRFHSELSFETIPRRLAEFIALPTTTSMDIWMPNDVPEVHLTFKLLGKPANRLPEAYWLSFSPTPVLDGDWTLDKMGQRVNPHNVIRGGGKHLHAVGKGFRYGTNRSWITISTLDAPLVALGEPDLLVFDDRDPEATAGVHVNLYNNLWGTAFPQWFDADMLFRFVLTSSQVAANGYSTRTESVRSPFSLDRKIGA